jgi:hypothetical protein
MIARVDPSAKMHAHLRMPSTPGVRDRSRRYTIIRARHKMHVTPLDRAAAATTPARPAKQGHGRMRGGLLLFGASLAV